MEVQDFIDFLFRIGFSDSKWKRELGILREEIADLKEKLIPFDNEELSLLSLTQSNVTSKRGFKKMQKGILETIYFEALFAYVIRDFGRDYRLTLVNSSQFEMVFLQKGQSTHVYIQDELVGYLTNDFVFMNNKRKPYGYIEVNSNTESNQVWIGGKNVGFVANPKIKRENTSRALSLFVELRNEESIIFMSMILAYLLDSKDI